MAANATTGFVQSNHMACDGSDATRRIIPAIAGNGNQSPALSWSVGHTKSQPIYKMICFI